MKKSQELRRRAEQVIANGALTNSKRPASFVEGVYPTLLQSGIGAKVMDVDGNWYVDYICGLGAHLFGYRNERIQQAAVAQICGEGTIFSLGSPLEVEVAEMFRDRFPQLQRLRFLKTASEACSAAVRIARAFTERATVLSDGYHGWHDEFVSLTPPAKGVYQYAPVMHPLKRFGYEVEMNGPGSVAAVIVEPVITELRVDSLRVWREECDRIGALLIFDETITGLRYPGFSVAKATGIDPDLTIMGKAIGGGFPLALVGGRAEVMETDYFVSSTFAGDCVALAAAKAVLQMAAEPHIMDRLWRDAAKFCDQLNRIAPELVTIEGYGTRGVFQANDDITKALFMQECCKAGILFGPTFFYGTEHPPHDDFTLSTCRSVLTRIATNQVRLEGKIPVKPYAEKVRSQ